MSATSFTGLLLTVGIPIVAIVFGMCFAAYSIYLKFRRQGRCSKCTTPSAWQRSRRASSCHPCRPSPFRIHSTAGPAAGECRRWRRGSGVTLLFVGAAVTVAIWAQGDRDFWWGLVIIAWGLGRLVGGYLENPSRGPQPGIHIQPPGGSAGPAPGPR